MTREEIDVLRADAEAVIAMASVTCRHPGGRHLFNCYGICQWCHQTEERVRATRVAVAYTTAEETLEKVREAWRDGKISVNSESLRRELAELLGRGE